MKIFLAVITATSLVLLTSCNKFLDEKSDLSMNVPSDLSDLQSLLDNYSQMNANYPSATEIMSDNYYLTTTDWNSISNVSLRNYYIWQKDDQYTVDWSGPYRIAFHANVVLDALKKLSATQKGDAAANIEGSAYFFRAFSFFSLAQLYAPVYDSTTAGSSLGIPLRLTADFNEPSTRSTLAETYNQIIADLKLAGKLLPESPAYANRPSKIAAFAGLARLYLSIQKYDQALLYADSALQINSELIDFNSLNASAAAPIGRFNKEVLFPAISQGTVNLNPSRARIDTALYQSYNPSDLRKTVLFKSTGNGTYAFKGSYDASANGSVFSGLTIPEMFLIKAESLARLNQTSYAMQTLNMLLVTRWKSGTFVPLTANNATDALTKILKERRKELLYRGLRWSDLRRLNKDSRFATTLTRKLNETYLLPPNSERYTLQIPRVVIDLSGIKQNP